ncbi:hypothetical protein [Solidesulfovibrio carbinoliphilus]|uniref:hypothetical protein n=1 Tax=Solidesulfovibrio carbinoliphilus TaxID=345370 RepID=UPI001E2A2F5F|nr:hypothetical protein [Solidesulfovibrio carbinoliphilus]
MSEIQELLLLYFFNTISCNAAILPIRRYNTAFKINLNDTDCLLIEKNVKRHLNFLHLLISKHAALIVHCWLLPFLPEKYRVLPAHEKILVPMGAFFTFLVLKDVKPGRKHENGHTENCLQYPRPGARLRPEGRAVIRPGLSGCADRAQGGPAERSGRAPDRSARRQGPGRSDFDRLKADASGLSQTESPKGPVLFHRPGAGTVAEKMARASTVDAAPQAEKS